MRRRVGERGLGFGASMAKGEEDKNTLRSMSRTEDLIKYGMIPEFMGRLPIIVSADELDVGRSGRDPVEAEERAGQAVREAVRAMEGVKLRFTEDALASVAEEASRRKSGARGLRAILEEVMLDVMYEIPSLTGVSRVRGHPRRGGVPRPAAAGSGEESVS